MTITLQTNDKAFGDGLHPSTEMAASLLSELAGQGVSPQNVLDIGCGSGILSFAALHYFPDISLVASDIEAESVTATRTNIAHNAPHADHIVLRADSYQHKDIKAGAPYDLIICNMLSDIIIKQSSDAAKHLSKTGFLVLSGILGWRKDEVIAAHEIHGLSLLAEVQMDEWWALLFHFDS